VDLIYTHPISGGQIYQCGAREIPGNDESFRIDHYDADAIIAALDEENISILALTAKGYQPRFDSPHPYLDVIHIPFQDRVLLEEWKIAQIETMVKRAAKKMGAAVERGERVLSTCRGGINRSSLLTAFIIKWVEDRGSWDGRLTSQQIIHMIRRMRDGRCLGNELFEAIVLHGF
jgi:hypothetical protein